VRSDNPCEFSWKEERTLDMHVRIDKTGDHPCPSEIVGDIPPVSLPNPNNPPTADSNVGLGPVAREGVIEAGTGEKDVGRFMPEGRANAVHP